MKRVVTALILIPFILYVTFLGPSWLLFAVVATVASLCYLEYAAIVAGHGIAKPGPAGIAAGVLLLAGLADPLLLVTLLTLLGFTLSLRARTLSEALPAAAAFTFGMVYIFCAWRFAILLHRVSPHWLLFALSLNWMGDTAALYIGRSFGKHKLAPSVSPGKSWEGAVASVLFSVLFGIAYLSWALPTVAMWQAGLLALVGNVIGQVGDLAESAVKRGAGVKDSGTLLPGHGGWLDRVDSSLFTLPAVYALLSKLPA